jgi:uncharacterized sulfatase
MASAPNVIFLFADQQRWDTCGCYRTEPVLRRDPDAGGKPANITPNLDRMAAEGVRFDMAFTCQPVCGPARAALQTGKYPESIGCPTNHRRLPPGETTVAGVLSGAGYETSYIGKWHLASCGPMDGPDNFRTRPVPPDRRGGYRDFWLASDALEFTSHSYDGHMFDGAGNKREFPAGRFRADVQTDWVIEYLRGRERTRPLFLFVSYLEPHHQNDHNRYEGPHGSKERFKDVVVPGDLAGLEGDWAEELPDYLGCCWSLDQNVGRIRSCLADLGMAENTVVIYTSDHGSHFRTRNREYKRSCHDGCTRIPLLVCGPGMRRGTVVDDLVSLVDLPPTILEAAGVAVPGGMHGRSLLHLAGGGASEGRDSVFMQISEHQCARAIRTKRWTYSVRAPDADGWKVTASDSYREDCLYDNDVDPCQHNNLAADESHAEIRAGLRTILLDHMRRAGETPPRILPSGKR